MARNNLLPLFPAEPAPGVYHCLASDALQRMRDGQVVGTRSAKESVYFFTMLSQERVPTKFRMKQGQLEAVDVVPGWKESVDFPWTARVRRDAQGSIHVFFRTAAGGLKEESAK